MNKRKNESREDFNLRYRIYRAANKDKINARKRELYHRDKELQKDKKVDKNSKKYKDKLEWSRMRWAKKRDEINKRRRERWVENKDEFNEKKRSYWKNNKLKLNYQARQRNIEKSIESLTHKIKIILS